MAARHSRTGRGNDYRREAQSYSVGPVSSVYPSHFQLAELTAHLVALLERRRAAFDVWDEKAEASLLEGANEALDEAGKQFQELADDQPYWTRTTEALREVAVPRYLRLAKAQHALEKRGYDAWRGGDFISRAAYAGLGLVMGVIILRTAIPNWLEPLPCRCLKTRAPATTLCFYMAGSASEKVI
jgi:hypothetical protein